MELYNSKRMRELLDDSDVAEVRVFKLKKGQRITIGTDIYKVTAVRPNGKATIRPV